MLRQKFEGNIWSKHIALLLALCMFITCFTAMPVFALDDTPLISDATTFTDLDGNVFVWNYDAETKTLTIEAQDLSKGSMNLNDSAVTETAPGTAWKSLPWNMTEYADAKKAENIIVSEGVSALGRQVFDGFKSLKNISLPTTLRQTQWGSIKDCTAIESVDLPIGFEALADKTFIGCSSLKSVTLPYTMKSISKNVISNTAVTSIAVPYKAVLSANAFDTDASNKLPDGFKVIIYNGSESDGWTGSANFKGTIEKAEYEGTTIASGTFADKAGKADAFTWRINDIYTLIIEGSGVMPSYDDNWVSKERPWQSYNKTIKRAVLGEGITATGMRVLEACTALESVSLPNSLTTVETYTFNGCPKISSLNIPKSVTTFKAQALYNMQGLTSVTIPSKVTTITANVFNRTNDDLEIKVYGGTKAYEVISADNDTIKTADNKGTKARKLTVLTEETGVVSNSDVHWRMSWDEVNQESKIIFSGSGDMPNASMSDRGWIGYKDSAVSVSFESGLTNVGKDCMNSFSKLTTVNIANTVKKIRDRAFAYCSSLTTLNISDKTEELGVGIIQGSTGVKEITVPKSVIIVYPRDTYVNAKTFIGAASDIKVKIYTDSPAYAWSKGKASDGTTAVDNAEGISIVYIDNDGNTVENPTVHLSNEDGFGVFTPEEIKNANIIFANYEYDAVSDKAGALKSINIVTKTELPLGYTKLEIPQGFNEESGTITKVFLWKSTESIVPMCVGTQKKNNPKLVLAGDSIMALWEQSELRYPQQGWGEKFIPKFEETKITVTNEAVSGYTAKAFYDNKWTKGVKDSLNAGDYLIVSFLQNDYCTYKDTTKAAYSPTYIETYTEYLQKYIDECKAVGVKLIFVQPPNKGVRYDFHDDSANSEYGNFTAVMPKLARDNNIPFIDVHKWTYDLLVNDSTYEQTMKDFYLYKLVDRGLITEDQHKSHLNLTVRNSTDATDTTHISLSGCEKIADYVAKNLKTVMPALAAYLKN